MLQLILMKRETVESIEELHLCPMCGYVSDEWKDIVDHMIGCHTDEKDLTLI